MIDTIFYFPKDAEQYEQHSEELSSRTISFVPSSDGSTGVIYKDGVSYGSGGSQGPQGPKGDDGDSAYDIYIKHGGTISTEEEWLESLRGPQGPQGPKGDDGSVTLSNNWGNSELIGITQKKLSEAHYDLLNQINAIVNDKAIISLKASPSVVFVNTQTGVTLTATTDTTASLIRIVTAADAAIIAEGSGSSLAEAVNLTMPSAGTAGYTALFTIGGIVKSTHVNISAVNKIYYGSGSAYTDATSSPSPKTSPAGTYTVVVPNNADYVFFVVPRTMNINNAKMSGFDFPIQPPVNVEIDGVEYKYYQSSNTYDAGTLTIEIS